MCCEPAMSQEVWEERGRRIQAALCASEARRPTRCPRCGSAEICFMFDPDMLLWLCTDCGRSFAERD
jgi:DNA-directed RNA polymerase subunit RPC12/RpoP